MPSIFSAFADEAGASCLDQITALTEAGFRHIDIRSIDGVNITALPVDHARQMRRQLDAVGIKVAMFGSPLGKIDIADDMKTDLDKLRHLAELAPIFDCRSVRIFSYYNQKANKPHAEFQEESLNRLRQLKTLAKDLGLTLYHENESHIFGDRSDDCALIAKEFRDAGSDGNFKMIFDFGNFNAGNENVWDAWLKLRDVSDALHLKDNAWFKPPGAATPILQHVPIGDGDGDIAKILTDAVRRNFSGPITLEPHLLHSAAVICTGPSGVSNQAYADMTLNQSFQIAAAIARQVIRHCGIVTT